MALVTVRGALAAAVATAIAGGALAHDPETFLKGDERISKGFTSKGEVEAKRAANTGKGMPSIRGPFEESFGLEFLGQLTNAELGVGKLAGAGAPFLSDIWGWTDRTGGACDGDEYALVGTSAGVSFARITDASGDPNAAPVFLGIVPTTNPNTLLNFWWDLKEYDNKVYWTTEVIDQGLGMFDLLRLCAIDAAEGDGTLEPDAYVEINLEGNTYRAAHNITVNTDDPTSPYAYITGVRAVDRSVSTDPMWIVDLSKISEPVGGVATVEAEGEFALLDGGTPIDSHDAQVVSYEGPDANWQGAEIAVVSAGGNLDLVVLDVSDPTDPQQISATGYPGASFTHQGWFDESQTWFFMGDEEDEVFGISDPRNPDLPDTTRTYVWDMTDLGAPQLLCFFDAPYAAIDHNMFIKGNLVYQANYTSGFTIWEIPDGGPDASEPNCGMTEIAHMDTEPRLPNVHMNNNINIFVGPWGIYPYFDTGKIIVSDGLNGLIVSRLED